MISEPNGPSAAPNRMRTTSMDIMLNVPAMAAQNTDHSARATAKTRLAPNLSDAQPPTKLNGA